LIPKVYVVEDEQILRVIDTVRTQHKEAADYLDTTPDINVRAQLHITIIFLEPLQLAWLLWTWWLLLLLILAFN
jgi:hypothetical protein